MSAKDEVKTAPPVRPLAPDGRTWLEWAADYHDSHARTQRRYAREWGNESYLSKMATCEAEQHEAAAQAIREAIGL